MEHDDKEKCHDNYSKIDHGIVEWPVLNNTHRRFVIRNNTGPVLSLGSAVAPKRTKCKHVCMNTGANNDSK